MLHFCVHELIYIDLWPLEPSISQGWMATFTKAQIASIVIVAWSTTVMGHHSPPRSFPSEFSLHVLGRQAMEAVV